MKKIILFPLFLLSALVVLSQNQYNMIGGVETVYKGQYQFTAKLDEKTMTLSFETDAPVSVVMLETYTPDQLIKRKPTEHLNTYKKTGNKYSYDLKKAELKGKEAYWLKVSTGENGAPLAEYYFRKRTAETATTSDTTVVATTSEPGEEIKNADGSTLINTNIKCTTGRTKVITALKKLDGVSKVTIDIKTGKLTIVYSSDGTPYIDILDAIHQQGFDAGGIKTTFANKNSCVKKIVK